jgi:hypothetical protein
MKVTVKLHVSMNEQKLLHASRSLKYGEILNVEMFSTLPETIQMDVFPEEYALIMVSRNETQEFSKIVVHDSRPVLAEYECSEQGFRCIKRIKLKAT